MTENNESENRRVDIEQGNYNERIEGNYVQGRNKFLNNTLNLVLFGRQGSSEVLSSAKHSRIRQALLKQVNDEVEIRINSSLHNRVYIVLDVEQNPEQIELPWASEIKVENLAKIKLDNTDIINVFDQEDVAGRLLILGQPGSGKTTMLLKLAEELVKRAKDNLTHPVPVLFSLSSWRNDNQSIKDWLVEQLKDKYGLRKDIGKQWIDNQEIIPLLDGLDEVAAERQEKCVLKINEFLHPSNWTNPLVVCSRIQEYQRSTSLLQLNNSLELYPFSHQQVYQYLQSTGHLQFWDSISQDTDLSQLAKTPLLLNIIVLSVHEISTQTWQGFKFSEEPLSYLFDVYIRKMLKRPYKGKDKQPKQENTQRWLTWLAQRLIEKSYTEFFIERMQPDWLKKKTQKVIYNCLSWGVTGALIFGVIYGMSDGGIDGGILKVIHKMIQGGIDGGIFGGIFGVIYRVTYEVIDGGIGNNIQPVKKSKFSLNNFFILITYSLIADLFGWAFGFTGKKVFGFSFAWVFVVIYGLIGDDIQPV